MEVDAEGANQVVDSGVAVDEHLGSEAEAALRSWSLVADVWPVLLTRTVGVCATVGADQRSALANAGTSATNLITLILVPALADGEDRSPGMLACMALSSRVF